MLIGAVLLTRALCADALAGSVDAPDPRFLAEWSSPGLNRSIKLAFASCYWDAEVSPSPAIEVRSCDNGAAASDD